MSIYFNKPEKTKNVFCFNIMHNICPCILISACFNTAAKCYDTSILTPQTD